MFNVLDSISGYKADLIIRKDRPFSIEEFRRRNKVSVLDSELFIVTPEDAILSKLEWSKAGQSERQFQDALGVATVQEAHLGGNEAVFGEIQPALTLPFPPHYSSSPWG